MWIVVIWNALSIIFNLIWQRHIIHLKYGSINSLYGEEKNLLQKQSCGIKWHWIVINFDGLTHMSIIVSTKKMDFLTLNGRC